MIQSVVITDFGKAVKASHSTSTTQNVWVSVSDPGHKDRQESGMSKRFRERSIKHFMQHFYDWSDEDPEEFIVKNIEQMGPREQHVNNIISFMEPFVASPDTYRLGVNCFAGVSRSTAIGIIAWVMAGKTPQQALQLILDVRPVAWPNLRILRFASDRLGRDIMGPIKAWKDAQQGILFH